MGTLKIGGRDARSTARKMPRTPPTQDTPSPIVDPAWGAVNEDPFTVDTDMTTELRASWLADIGVWQAQHLNELAPLTRKYARLACKLEDPALADNPHRPDGIKKARAMHADIVQRVRDLITDECQADRVWQSLTPKERSATDAPGHWMTEATEDRLIGRTWFALATFETWPRGWRIERNWLRGLPLVTLMDLRTFKVFAWQPNPPEPSIWTDNRDDDVPEDIRKEALKGRTS